MFAASYYVAEENMNCPEITVNTVSECTRAAEQLGLNYEETVENSKRPAGCYTWLHDGRQDASFNSILDPSSTSPEDKTSGICRAGNIC